MKIGNYWRSLSRWEKRLVYVALILAVYLGALGGVLPVYLERLIPEKVAEITGREVSVDVVTFNPFSTHLRIGGLRIKEQMIEGEQSQPDFLAIGEIGANVSILRSLFSLGPVFDELSLSQPDIEIVYYGEQGFNFTDILEQVASGSEEEEAEASEPMASLPKFRVSKLRISEASIGFLNQDLPVAQDLSFTKITLNADDFDLRGQNELSFSFRGPGDSEFKLDSEYSLVASEEVQDKLREEEAEPFAPGYVQTTGSLQFSKFDLADFWPQIGHLVEADLTSAVVALELPFVFSQTPKEMRFSLSNAEFNLQDLKLSANNAELVAMEDLSISSVGFDLLEQNVSVGQISSEGLVVNASLADDGLDLVNLLTPQVESAELGSTGEETSAGLPSGDSENSDNEIATNTDTENSWEWQLGQLTLSGYAFELTDTLMADSAVWSIDQVALSLENLGSQLDAPAPYTFSAQVQEEAALQLQGSIEDLDTPSVTQNISFTGFSLINFQPYLDGRAALDILSGTFGAEGTLNLSLGETTQALFEGGLDIRNMHAVDRLIEEDFLKWELLGLEGIQFDLAQSVFSMERMALDQAFARIVVGEDGTTNIGHILSAGEVEEEAAAPEDSGEETVTEMEPVEAADASDAGSPFAVSLNKLEITDSSAFFADYSLTPKFATGIENLSGSVENLNSKQDQLASVDIRGQVDRYAPVSLTGTLNPLAPTAALDLELNFDDMQLSSLNPYSGTYAGYYIDQGLLSLALNYELEGTGLEGENHVLVKSLEFGQKSDSDKATSLPIGLAVALLENSEGVIDLNLKVSGDLDDPAFNIGSLVMQAFTNIIVKAVSAPFALIGALVGGEGESMNQLEFVAGVASLKEGEESKLENLTKALTDRPRLLLSVRGAVNPANDAMAIAEERLALKLNYQGLEPISPSAVVDDAVLAASVRRLFQDTVGKSIPEARTELLASYSEEEQPTEEELETRLYAGMYNQLLEAEEVQDEDLIALASARSQAVQRAFIEDYGLPGYRLLLQSSVELNGAGSLAQLELVAN